MLCHPEQQGGYIAGELTSTPPLSPNHLPSLPHSICPPPHQPDHHEPLRNHPICRRRGNAQRTSYISLSSVGGSFHITDKESTTLCYPPGHVQHDTLDLYLHTFSSAPPAQFVLPLLFVSITHAPLLARLLTFPGYNITAAAHTTHNTKHSLTHECRG